MHRDPALSVQKLILDTLLADTSVTAIVGDRIYDHVPESVSFPFIQIGDDSFDYQPLSVVVTSTVRLFTESIGMPAVKTLGAATFTALLSLEEPEMLDDWHLDRIERVTAEYMSDIEHNNQMGELVLTLDVSA